MSRFVIVVLCVQACLIQNALSSCSCGVEQISYSSPRLIELPGLNCEQIYTRPSEFPGINVVEQIYQPSVSVSTPGVSLGAPSLGRPSYSGSYGGSGTGEVAVSGDIGASGQTVVVGSVPVLGAVDFAGVVSAAGSVTISGQCGCGCY